MLKFGAGALGAQESLGVQVLRGWASRGWGREGGGCGAMLGESGLGVQWGRHFLKHVQDLSSTVCESLSSLFLFRPIKTIFMWVDKSFGWAKEH